MQEILELILNNGWTIPTAITIVGLILNFLLKKFITEERLQNWGESVKKFAKGVGIIVTLGLAKLPYLKKLWNNILEPYVVIFLRLAIINFLDGFIEGLESDNKSTK